MDAKETKDINPYTENFTQASEYLRLALALLTNCRISPSPLNFRLGYDAVSGKDETLRATFGKISRGSVEPSQDDLWTLYQQTYEQDDQAVGNMRQELRRMITNVQSQFEHSGNDLSSYVQTLNQFAGVLDGSASPEKMAVEVDKVIQHTHSTEESQKQSALNLANIAAEVSSLRNELEQVRQESLTDALTGISNRKAFDTMLEQNILQHREEHAPFSLLLADIDHFKQFNDTYGHLVGDKVLRFVAASLKRCLKGNDVVARFGGEEFTAILPKTGLDSAAIVAEQIRQAVSAGSLKDKASQESYGRVTISIGVAQFVPDDLPNILIARADQALYLAKEQGRDRIEKATLASVPATGTSGQTGS